MYDKKIILIGGGGHCRSCIDVIEREGVYRIAGIVEREGAQTDETVSGYPVIGYDKDLKSLRDKFEYALITVGQIGSSRIRQKRFNQLKTLQFQLPVIVSPTALVSQKSMIEEGTIVMHQVIVNAGAHVGKNCILNTKCLIEHDVQIGNHSHISTAAVVNGGSKIGKGSFVGSNATVIQNIVLPDGYFFKAGSLITDQQDGKPIE